MPKLASDRDAPHDDHMSPPGCSNGENLSAADHDTRATRHHHQRLRNETLDNLPDEAQGDAFVGGSSSDTAAASGSTDVNGPRSYLASSSASAASAARSAEETRAELLNPHLFADYDRARFRLPFPCRSCRENHELSCEFKADAIQCDTCVRRGTACDIELYAAAPIDLWTERRKLAESRQVIEQFKAKFEAEIKKREARGCVTLSVASPNLSSPAMPQLDGETETTFHERLLATSSKHLSQADQDLRTTLKERKKRVAKFEKLRVALEQKAASSSAAAPSPIEHVPESAPPQPLSHIALPVEGASSSATVSTTGITRKPASEGAPAQMEGASSLAAPSTTSITRAPASDSAPAQTLVKTLAFSSDPPRSTIRHSAFRAPTTGSGFGRPKTASGLLAQPNIAAGDPDPTFFPTPSSRSGAGLGAQLPLGLASSDGTNVFARAFPPATSSLSRSRFAGDGAVPAPALTPTLLDPVAIRQQSVGVEAVEARKTWSKSQWENARAASALDDRLTIERGFAQMHVSDRATWPPISSAEGRPTSDFHERLNHIALRYPGYQTLPPHAMPRVRLAREALLQPHEDLYYQSAYPCNPCRAADRYCRFARGESSCVECMEDGKLCLVPSWTMHSISEYVASQTELRREIGEIHSAIEDLRRLMNHFFTPEVTTSQEDEQAGAGMAGGDVQMQDDDL